jgi:predicted TPR repeat methyltransferase
VSTQAAERCFREGLTLFLKGEHRKAETAFRSALAEDRNHPDALHFLGFVAFRTGQSARALRLVRRSIRLRPTHAGFRYNLGLIHYEHNRLRGALAAWQATIRLDETNEDAHTNIGIIRLRLGQFEKAAEVFSKVTTLNPYSAVAWGNLAVALEQSGRKDEARKARTHARNLNRDYESLVQLGNTRLRAGSCDEALVAFRRAVKLRPSNPLAILYLGHTWSALDRHDKALEAYRRARTVDPGNATINYFIAALGGTSVPPAPPRDYVRAFFDQFSLDYDKHLIRKLQYRVPAVLCRMVRQLWANDRRASKRPSLNNRTAIRRIASPRDLKILDAGCGTGLAAPLLRRLAARLVGIDLSLGMINKARALGTYDELIVGGLAEQMRTRPRAFDLVFAADVFCYQGDLVKIFGAAFNTLRRGGLLAFSVESCCGYNYVLRPSGRYAHPQAYIRRLAKGEGLIERRVRSVTLRIEKGQPVTGDLFIFQKI